MTLPTTAEELRAFVEREVAGLKANRDELRREKEKLQAQIVSDRLMAYATKLADPYRRSEPDGGMSSGAGHVLTREEARDPVRYRAAKRAAEAAGIKGGPLLTGEGLGQPGKPGAVPSMVQTERSVFIRRDVASDVNEYRRVRRLADQSGRKVQMFEGRNDFAASGDPEAVQAFDAAMRGES